MGSSKKDNIFSRPAGKSPEKSNFTQTCNLLSQFLKEMRNRGDVSFGTCPKLENKEKPTMNLLMHLENPAEDSRQYGVASTSSANPVDLSPQFIDLDPPTSIEDFDKADSRKWARVEPITAQMTIFYAGKVMVFNDFSAEKAKEVVDLARKDSSGKPNSFLSNIDLNKTDSDNSMPSENVNTPECLRERSQDSQSINGSDSPNARRASFPSQIRRASLHRFLNKRKDRVVATAPYPPVNQRNSFSPPTKSEEGLSRNEDEGQCSKQLELRL